MRWELVYREQIPTEFLVGFGVVAGCVGLACLPWNPLVGSGTLVLAAGLPAWLHQMAPRSTVACEPTGFVVTTRHQRSGKQQAQYGWHEITSTSYGETARPFPTGYFMVETEQGVAFRLSHRTAQFQDLIEVVNAMTPHLPYRWQRGAGLSVPAGQRAESPYRRVPR